MKAILLSKITDQVDKDILMEVQLGKLRIYAKNNSFEIIKEFKTYENTNLSESLTFLEILKLIKSQPDKICVICYGEFNTSNTEIDQVFRELLSQDKIEIENYSHPCFKEPLNNSVKIWRYITLPKFIDLLQTKTLFFTRADFLRKEDNSECTYLTDKSLKSIEAFNELSQKKLQNSPPTKPNTLNYYKEESDIRINSFNEDILIKQNYINCWHMNNFENYAMWKIYSENFGVCIQSTYHDLYSSFEIGKYGFYNKKNKIYIGEVNYIDWNTCSIPQDNLFWAYMHKKKEFEYENELRCILSNKDDALYLKIKINTDILLSNIYINPFTPTWFKQSIENLCRQYGISERKVIQSSLT